MFNIYETSIEFINNDYKSNDNDINLDANRYSIDELANLLHFIFKNIGAEFTFLKMIPNVSYFKPTFSCRLIIDGKKFKAESTKPMEAILEIVKSATLVLYPETFI
jgi:hypothetical protein